MSRSVLDLMTHEPATCSPEDSTLDAARAMSDGDFGSVLVARDGHLLGILTDRDIVLRVVARGLDPATTPIADILTPDPTTLRADADSEEALQAFRSRHVRRLPVVDGDRPIGILSIGDIAMSHQEPSLLGDLSAAPANN